MADGHGSISSAGLLANRAPFRAPSEASGERRAVWEGSLPPWLRGAVFRTAPARFTAGSWESDHWFDALGLLFSFSIEPSGATLRWRELNSAFAREVREGRFDRASFGTRMRRGFFEKLRSPAPAQTDNANVNIVPRGEALVALTESVHELVVDPETLSVLREHEWHDELGAMASLAHPEFDRAKGRWVNVGTALNGRPALVVFEHDVDGRARREVGRWHPGRVPYTHSFGLTERFVLLIGHPLTANPLTMLFSDRGFIEHFEWDRSAPTRLAVMDRSTGAVREVSAPGVFVFHTIDAFEDEDGHVVLDVLTYPDTSIIETLRTDSLARATIDLSAKPERWRIAPGASSVLVEPLGTERFEFPSVDRRTDGPRRSLMWGANVTLDGSDSRSRLVAVDRRGGAAKSFAQEGMVYGEPLFVGRPGATEEGDGVLLSVGSHTRDSRSTLAVVDARSMELVASASVDVSLPLGFHGGFSRSRAER
jgi:beta,beta-carotene 9',10'-dioxygenase